MHGLFAAVSRRQSGRPVPKSGEQCQLPGRIETGGARRLLRFRGLEVLLTPPLRVAGDMARVTADM